MARVLKVFGSVEERKQLAAKHTLLADYDAFTLLEVADQQVKAIARSHLVGTSHSNTGFPSATPWPTPASLESPRAAWRARTEPTRG